MTKIMVKCDCDASDKCPQGRTGGMRLCSILRDERIEPTIERPDNPLQDLVDGAHIRCDVLTSRVSQLEKRSEARDDAAACRLAAHAERIDALEKREAQHDHYSHKRMDRLDKVIDQLRSDMGKNLQATDLTLKTQDRAIGILGETTDNLEKHCEALEASRTILHQEQFAACKRIGKLEEVVRLKTGSVAYEGVAVASKRVIKGGWVAIFHQEMDGELRAFAGRAVWVSEDTALSDRCGLLIPTRAIQIPDITEGEGL